MKVLIICTGNTCRSQIAEGLLKTFDPALKVFSAGTQPMAHVNPYAIRVMAEVGIDISNNRPKHVDEFLSQEFDYVITVCDGAKETCPIFTGKVKNSLHIGFEDPADSKGTDNEIMEKFRDVRNQIKARFWEFYQSM
jgi:arsenate reductase (thioredoxin)